MSVIMIGDCDAPKTFFHYLDITLPPRHLVGERFKSMGSELTVDIVNLCSLVYQLDILILYILMYISWEKRKNSR